MLSEKMALGKLNKSFPLPFPVSTYDAMLRPKAGEKAWVFIPNMDSVGDYNSFLGQETLSSGQSC